VIPPLLSNRTVAQEKISHYLLNPDHRVGGPKARFFLGVGFSLDQWSRMAAALNSHPEANPVEEIATRFGTKYVVRCNVATPDGRNPCIVTVWMQEQDDPARLVTAYPARARGYE
jgi:filamentous hemagglutinin